MYTEFAPPYLFQARASDEWVKASNLYASLFQEDGYDAIVTNFQDQHLQTLPSKSRAQLIQNEILLRIIGLGVLDSFILQNELWVIQNYSLQLKNDSEQDALMLSSAVSGLRPLINSFVEELYSIARILKNKIKNSNLSERLEDSYYRNVYEKIHMVRVPIAKLELAGKSKPTMEAYHVCRA